MYRTRSEACLSDRKVKQHRSRPFLTPQGETGIMQFYVDDADHCEFRLFAPPISSTDLNFITKLTEVGCRPIYSAQ